MRSHSEFFPKGMSLSDICSLSGKCPEALKPKYLSVISFQAGRQTLETLARMTMPLTRSQDNVYHYVTAKAYTGVKDVLGELFWAKSFDWINNLAHRKDFTYTSGCMQCHGSDVKVDADGRTLKETWPADRLYAVSPAYSENLFVVANKSRISDGSDDTAIVSR